mgnify:CR=1 FL=1
MPVSIILVVLFHITIDLPQQEEVAEASQLLQDFLAEEHPAAAQQPLSRAQTAHVQSAALRDATAAAFDALLRNFRPRGWDEGAARQLRTKLRRHKKAGCSKDCVGSCKLERQAANRSALRAYVAAR